MNEEVTSLSQSDDSVSGGAAAHLAPRTPTGRVAFGPFELDPVHRTLCLNDQPVHIRQRELDILLYLVARAGEFVPREELIAQVWSTTTVSEANLRVQIASLRRTLSDDSIPSYEWATNERYILSASGRGYQFCGRLRTVDDARRPAPRTAYQTPGSAPKPAGRHNLPIRLKPAFGREQVTAKLMATLPAQRLATVVGTGGIGKTTLALTVAETVVDAYEDGVRFVNLAGLSNPSLIAGVMAGTLGILNSASGSEADLIRFIADRHILFVLDNCEHVIEAAARLVQQILSRTPNAHFLCTSREPLHIDGEWLMRLGPLDLPPRRAGLTATEAIAYPAVRLFVERARLSDSLFELADADAATAAELCRRLDGNPLAVELAAACVGMFGIQGLASQLSDSFGTLTQGRRTALPRHQTLRATLDWSYDILSADEQRLLRRLAIFRGDFTLASARLVAGDAGPEDDFVDWLSELSAKSLLNVDLSQQPAHYRMLFLTRDYAFGKLTESGELAAIAGRHAAHLLDLLSAASPAVKSANAAGWIDDLRFAFEWSMSDCGDPVVGMRLVINSIELGRWLSILGEYAGMLERGLAHFDTLPGIDPKIGVRMLIETLIISLQTEEPPAQGDPLFARAETLARAAFQTHGDPSEMFEVTLTKFARAFGSGDSPAMTQAANEVADLAVQCGLEAGLRIAIGRISAQAAHFNGELARSSAFATSVLACSDAEVEARIKLPGDRIDPRINTQIIHARTLWLTGRPEQASAAAQAALARADGAWEHVACYVLAFAIIPISVWRGDVDGARIAAARLAAKVDTFSLAYWHGWARAYEALLGLQQTGANGIDPQVFARGPDILLDHLASLHDGGLSPVALLRADQGLAGWCTPEVLRRHADTELDAGRLDAAGAEARLLRAHGLACTQGACAWELKAAISLGRLWQGQARSDDAVALLDAAMAHFSEGLGDTDFVTAQTLRLELISGRE